MDGLYNMKSETNSLNGVRERYKKGIIETYEDICENYDTLIVPPGCVGEGTQKITTTFNNMQNDVCRDDSMGSNSRWGIVALKNFFGLSAELYPRQIYARRTNAKPNQDEEIYLKACAGRFQPDKFRESIFPNVINISDILFREPDEQFRELEEFYNMTNKELFKKFGVYAEVGKETNLLANCLVFDSLLKDRYSDLEGIRCASTYGYDIDIKLTDGTKFFAYANSEPLNGIQKGITIQKDGREARVGFDTISIRAGSKMLTSIDNLEVENVVYTGDPELIAQLQKAMQEQFKSQQKVEDKSEELGEAQKQPEDSKVEQPKEKNGAQKIIDFMKENNFGNNDLAFALSMIIAQKQDKTIAEQHISNVDDKTEKAEGNGKINPYDARNREYKSGILNAYKYLIRNQGAIINGESPKSDRFELSLEFIRSLENAGLINSCFYGHKNLFGVECVPFPNDVYNRDEPIDTSKALYLSANRGRIDGLAGIAFPNLINISDIADNENEEGYTSEFETFYNMNNRQVFERFGVDAKVGDNTNLIASYIVLDSLLQGKHSDIENVSSSQIEKMFSIKLADGAEIYVNLRELNGLKKGISIKKDGKEARVDFNTRSIGERSDVLTSVNDLEVENVVYDGDPELIAQLQQAMQEQFKSQQKDGIKNQLKLSSELHVESVDTTLEELTALRAQKIIDFMRENNLKCHDLSLALTMLASKITDKATAEQHLIGVSDKNIEKPEESKTEY